MSYRIDQDSCSCCHRCRVECPKGAIAFEGMKYQINLDKCVACGYCESICHNGAIFNTYEAELKKEPEQHELIQMSCDVVVVGGGGSGMTAAARAAASGCKVIVLEKGHEIGGSAWYAHMFRNHYSQWHKEAGLPDQRDEVYAEFMEKTENRLNGKLVKRLLGANQELVDWLIDDHDLGADYEFGMEGPFGKPGLVSKYVWDYNAKRIDCTIGPGGNGWYMVNKMHDILMQNEGQVVLNTEVYEIMTDDSGAVVGVKGKDAGGEIEIMCKSCIITAGAYTHGKDIMEKMQPLFNRVREEDAVHIFTYPKCTGDGIRMCESIGATIDYENKRAGIFGPARHPFGMYGLLVTREPHIPLFNKNGDYYEPKPPTEVSQTIEEPGKFLWAIVNEHIMEEGVKRHMSEKKEVVNFPMEETLANWKKEMKEEPEWSVVTADSLEALAHKLEFEDVKAFCEKYESLMDEKALQAPFYAFYQRLFHENAIGGMTTDHHMNVLKENEPIAGLYAAGDNTRGVILPGPLGVMYIEGIISALTYAITSGYIAGKEAANNAKNV